VNREVKKRLRRHEWKWLRKIESELRDPPVYVAGDPFSKRAAEKEWAARNERLVEYLWWLDRARWRASL
jgi:hypothetical protein